MFLKDETKYLYYLKWKKKQRQSDCRIEMTQNMLLLPLAPALLIPIVPTVWNCPTRTYLEVCFCSMDLLWLLGCSQNSEVRGIRAIWMKFSPTKAGTKASTSCHPCRITNVDCRIYTAPTVHSQPSGLLLLHPTLVCCEHGFIKMLKSRAAQSEFRLSPSFYWINGINICLQFPYKVKETLSMIFKYGLQDAGQGLELELQKHSVLSTEIIQSLGKWTSRVQGKKLIFRRPK